MLATFLTAVAEHSAAGRTVQHAGFPLTARCDMIWPEHKEANDVTQYLHLNATLIAPLEGDPADRENPAIPGNVRDKS